MLFGDALQAQAQFAFQCTVFDDRREVLGQFFVHRGQCWWQWARVFSLAAQLGTAGLIVLLVAYAIVVALVKRRSVRIAGLVVIAVAMLASLALLDVPLEEVPLTIVD